MKTIRVTCYWDALEAAAMLTFLDELRDAIVQVYGNDIAEQFRKIKVEQQNNTEEQWRLPFEDVEF